MDDLDSNILRKLRAAVGHPKSDGQAIFLVLIDEIEEMRKQRDATLAEVDRLTALLPSSDPNPRYLGQIARLTAESKITCADCLHMGPYGCTNIDKSAAFRCKHGPPPSDKTPLPYARMDCAGFEEKP